MNLHDGQGQLEQFNSTHSLGQTASRNIAQQDILNQDIHHFSKNDHSINNQASMAYCPLRASSKESTGVTALKAKNENVNFNNISRDSIRKTSVNSR